jgi:hypothetical protein
MCRKCSENSKENKDDNPHNPERDHYSNLFGTNKLLRQLIGQLFR